MPRCYPLGPQGLNTHRRHWLRVTREIFLKHFPDGSTLDDDIEIALLEELIPE